MKQLKNSVQFWIGACRAPFFIAVITPAILGTAIAWAMEGVFYWQYFVPTLIGVMLINGGTNLVNDYFDHKSGTDEANHEFIAPFTGGSRMIQKGLLKPSTVLYSGIIFFILAALIGVYLIYARGTVILILGVIGVLSGYFYTAPPFKLGYRWAGEFVVGLNCGILVTFGAYYVQAQQLAWQPIIAAIPLALLIIAILWVNEIPDYTADKTAGKRHLVVVLGKSKSASAYALILIVSYIAVILGVAGGWIDPNVGTPPLALLALLTLPLGIKLIRIVVKHYDNLPSLAPANATTPQLYLLTGLLLSLGFIIERLIGG